MPGCHFNYMVSSLKFAHVGVDRFNHTCAVDHGDAAILGRCGANDYGVIVKVEGAGVNSNPHFPGPKAPVLQDLGR